jgi:hypothetical protein
MPRRKLSELQQMNVNRFNAMKHGFATRSPVLPDVEDESDWKRHLKGMMKSFAPEGYFEEYLVRRLATITWEVDRLTAYQVAQTMGNVVQNLTWAGVAENLYKKPKDFTEPDEHDLAVRLQSTLLPASSDLEVIMRYGSQLHRQWIQVHHQLLAVQARRHGEKVPLAMVDMIGAPPNFGPFRTESPATQQARDMTKLADARVAQAKAAQSSDAK